MFCKINVNLGIYVATIQINPQYNMMQNNMYDICLRDVWWILHEKSPSEETN